jgi:hypothetical protein
MAKDRPVPADLLKLSSRVSFTTVPMSASDYFTLPNSHLPVDHDDHDATGRSENSTLGVAVNMGTIF